MWRLNTVEKKHQIPVVEVEGLNLEEKETRHDIDKKMNKAMNLRSKMVAKCKNISE